MSSSLILDPRPAARGGRWWAVLRTTFARLGHLHADRGAQTVMPDAMAALDARTLRDIGAPDAWQQAARERAERHEQALSLDALRARGGLGA